MTIRVTLSGGDVDLILTLIGNRVNELADEAPPGWNGEEADLLGVARRLRRALVHEAAKRAESS
jgi:hypothetical protein